jgi:hypothetical protein
VRGGRESGVRTPVEEDENESEEQDEGGEENKEHEEVDDDGKMVSDGHCSLISTNVHVITN